MSLFLFGSVPGSRAARDRSEHHVTVLGLVYGAPGGVTARRRFIGGGRVFFIPPIALAACKTLAKIYKLVRL